MANNRTQIVCLCEGEAGRSIDAVFINRLLRTLKPSWLRPWGGSNIVRIESCGGRKRVIETLPDELRACEKMGGHTTLMVWADCDDDAADGDQLKEHFWKEAEQQGIKREAFDRVVFVFPKDRIENWIEFLQTGATDESKEGPRVQHGREVADAAKKLAAMCKAGKPIEELPPSLKWSCDNWHVLVERMTTS